MRRSGVSQRSQMIAATTTATTSSAPITYLFAANHDCESAVELENGAEFLKPETSAGRAVLLSVRISGDEAAEESCDAGCLQWSGNHFLECCAAGCGGLRKTLAAPLPLFALHAERPALRHRKTAGLALSQIPQHRRHPQPPPRPQRCRWRCFESAWRPTSTTASSAAGTGFVSVVIDLARLVSAPAGESLPAALEPHPEAFQ